MDKAKRKLIEGWLDKASKQLQVAREHLNSYTHTSEAIERAQECIELSVKATFLLLGVRLPLFHGLDPERKKSKFSEVAKQIRDQQLIEKLEKAGLGYSVRLPRMLLLFNFWGNFYTAAKYGYEAEHLAPAQDLFDRKEAELAVFHADECLRTASQLRYLSEEKRRALVSEDGAS